jgi:hypothetical protein
MPMTPARRAAILRGDNPNYASPKVPGINAQPLMPSIGVDHHRTSAKQKVRMADTRKSVAAIGGAGRLDMASPSRAKKADPRRFAPMTPAAKPRKATKNLPRYYREFLAK